MNKFIGFQNMLCISVRFIDFKKNQTVEQLFDSHWKSFKFMHIC